MHNLATAIMLEVTYQRYLMYLRGEGMSRRVWFQFNTRKDGYD